MLIKKIMFPLAALILMLTITVTILPAAESTAPAATVNGKEIPRQRVEEMANYLRFQFLQSGKEIQKEQFAGLMLQALNILINQEILYQAAVEKGYTVNKAEIDVQVEELKRQSGGEQNFLEGLNNRAMTLEDLKQELIQTILWKEFQQKEFESKISVTSREVREYYDTYPEFFSSPPLVRAHHILIKVGPNAPQVEVVEAMAKIDAVQKKLEAGQTFEELARQYSEGPSAPDGGSLGYINPGQMDPNFEKTAFTLTPGKVSNVIRTRFGFHIIKVTDRRPGQLTPFPEVREYIIEHLKTAKTNREVEIYLDQKKQNTAIELP